MTKAAKEPLFSNLLTPQYRLADPTRVLSEADVELMAITVEDYRYVTRDVTEDLPSVPAEIRARATILRRLLSDHDIFRTGKVLRPQTELRVRARMLEFDPIHPSVLLSCGNYPWAGDRLPGISVGFSIKGVPPLTGTPWNYREDADVSLSDYLDGLAFAIVGTPVRRREVIKYVGDKKSAHVSDRRKHLSEQALDRVWSQLFITIANPEGQRVRLNQVYLEILAIVEALASSESIREYIDELQRWVRTAEATFPGAKSETIINMPIQPL